MATGSNSQLPYSITLTNFFIFNPSLAKSEGEEEKKLLYFYPAHVDKDSQLKHAGLCEALIKFSASFHPDHGCDVFTTEKSKQVLFEPEPGFWIVMTVAATVSNCVTARSDPSDFIQDNVCSSILRLANRMFQIFSGSFQFTLEGKETEEKLQMLRAKLDHFYNKYLPTISIQNGNILDIFQGIQYLPLNREPFLHVQSFINLVEVQFSSIRHSMFLSNDHLVWSGIDPEDTQVLYQYLVYSLLPSHPDLELQGGSLQGVSPTKHYGCFVTRPPDLQDSVVSTEHVRKVYLSGGSGTECLHLVVYRALSATLCLFMKEEAALSLELFQKLDEHIGPRLTSLVSEISEYGSRNSSGSNTDTSPRFIYFNQLNRAIKSSVLEARKGGPPVIQPEIMRILSGLNAKKDLFCDNGEIIVTTANDTWIVVKFSNGREFYIVTQKKASLVEIGAEVKKVCDTQLRGIFFLTN